MLFGLYDALLCVVPLAWPYLCLPSAVLASLAAFPFAPKKDQFPVLQRLARALVIAAIACLDSVNSISVLLQDREKREMWVEPAGLSLLFLTVFAQGML